MERHVTQELRRNPEVTKVTSYVLRQFVERLVAQELKRNPGSKGYVRLHLSSSVCLNLWNMPDITASHKTHPEDVNVKSKYFDFYVFCVEQEIEATNDRARILIDSYIEY